MRKGVYIKFAATVLALLLVTAADGRKDEGSGDFAETSSPAETWFYALPTADSSTDEDPPFDIDWDTILKLSDQMEGAAHIGEDDE